MGWDLGEPYIPFMFQGIWSSLQWSNRSWWGSFPLPFCSSRAAQTRVCGRFGPPLGPWSSEPVPCGCCKVVVLQLHLFACFRGWGFGYFRWANGEEGPWHRSTWRRTKEGTWALACFLPLVAQYGGGPYACALFFFCPETYLPLLLLYPQKSTLMIIMALCIVYHAIMYKMLTAAVFLRHKLL